MMSEKNTGIKRDGGFEPEQKTKSAETPDFKGVSALFNTAGSGT